MTIQRGHILVCDYQLREIGSIYISYQLDDLQEKLFSLMWSLSIGFFTWNVTWMLPPSSKSLTLWKVYQSVQCFESLIKLLYSVSLLLRNDLHCAYIWHIANFFHFHRDAVLPVTCGAFLMFFGICTQGTQHPDAKQMSQSVPCVRENR